MLTVEDVAEIARNVFATMLQTESYETGEENFRADDAEFVGCIQISGAWEGGVRVTVPRRFATQAASILLCIPSNEIVFDDQKDTLAEITNMIGGNIKSLVPGPSSLSLPTVACGLQIEMSIRNTETVNNTYIDIDGDVIEIMVFQKT